MGRAGEFIDLALVTSARGRARSDSQQPRIGLKRCYFPQRSGGCFVHRKGEQQ
jgi:hypothetical protein